MSKYNVTVYYTTYVEVEVEADSEENAINEAYLEAGKKEYNDVILNHISASDYPEVIPLDEDEGEDDE